MVWKFNDEQPIYQQIISQIKERIVAGEWKAGDKLKSVRELALEAGVNPNTMQKALAELEREGLVYSQRTAGRFVSDNKEKTDRLLEEMTMECIKTFVAQMEKMGYKKEQIIEMLNKTETQLKNRLNPKDWHLLKKLMMTVNLKYL